MGANTATISTPSASPSSTVWGQATTLSVIVTGVQPQTASNQLSGNINFFDGLTLLNANPIPLNVISNVGTTQLTLVLRWVRTPSLPSIWATRGSPLYNPLTSAPLIVQTNKADTTSTVSAPLNMTFGVGVTVSGSVSVNPPAAGVPTGTMSFFANPGNIALGTGTLSGGSTSITVSMQLLPGNYSVFSVYNGDGNDNTSTSVTAPMQVNKNGTNGSLTTTPVGNAALNQAVTLTATFVPQSAGQGFPSGTVAFTDTTGGVIALGTATLNNQGIATLTTTAILPGLRTLTATWAGDVSYNPPAVPPTALLNVSTGTTIITLTPSPSAVPLGAVRAARLLIQWL